MRADPLSTTILTFVAGIGLVVDERALTEVTAVPGITVDRGVLVVDPGAELFPGDLLHEAGHLALLTPSARATATGRLGDELGAGYELGVICWSVAAAWHLHLDLEVVFHERGYRGDGAHLAALYRDGRAPGVPLLAWAGLAWEPGRAPPGEQPYPAMRRWVRVDEIPIA